MPKRNNLFRVAIALILVFSMNISILSFAQDIDKLRSKLTADQQRLAETLVKAKEIINIIKKEYYVSTDNVDFYDDLLKGLFLDLDDYSIYYTKEEYDKLKQDVTGRYSGIGIRARKEKANGPLVVVEVFAAGSAKKAGIQVGDEIVYINGSDVSKLTQTEAIDKIVGEVGTQVKLDVLRDGKKLNFQVYRKEIKKDSVHYKVIDKENNLYLIKIDQFIEGTADEFKKIYNTIYSRGAKGFVIDVRDNPGGYVDEAAAIADYLLGEQIITYTKGRRGDVEEYLSDAKRVSLPFVYLVNEESASSSEILAGAIQFSKASKIIGVKTFGKGIIQTYRELKDGSALKLTTEQYYTPDHKPVNKIGIKPDIKVELDEKAVKNDPKSDNQIKESIKALKKLIEER